MEQKMIDELKSRNGKKHNRIITQSEIDKIIDLIAEHKDDEKAVTIRVYPADAFVPNSYKYRAETLCLQAVRHVDGSYVVAVISVDAHRSNGRGAHVTINGKAA